MMRIRTMSTLAVTSATNTNASERAELALYSPQMGAAKTNARAAMATARQEAEAFFEARAAITRNAPAYGYGGRASYRPTELAYQEKVQKPAAREATVPIQKPPKRQVIQSNQRQSDAEINRLLDRIYEKLEHKIRTESRRFGF